MLSWIFLTYAAVHLTIWFWGWRAWSRTGRPVALLLVLICGTLLWYDNFRIGIGRFIGPGELLYTMSIPAFVWHWTMLPLLVIAAASVARLAHLGWARNKIVMGAFCVVAVSLSALDIPKIFGLELYEACIADTIRYSTNSPANQLCSPDQAAFTRGPGAALVAIITNVIVLAVGIALWVRRGWKWMALGSGAMFVAAAGSGGSAYGLPIANFGEILITLGMISSAVHFARLREQAPAGRDATTPTAQARA